MQTRQSWWTIEQWIQADQAVSAVDIARQSIVVKG